MNLTPHFTLGEAIRSDWAKRNGVDNTPPDDIIINISITALGMEKVRVILNNLPIIVSSWYRCNAVNKGVGGSKTSAHMKGFAVDFICPKFGTPLDICKAIAESDLQFDQLIEEGTWVHISFDPKMRRQILTKLPNGYATGLKN